MWSHNVSITGRTLQMKRRAGGSSVFNQLLQIQWSGHLWTTLSISSAFSGIQSASNSKTTPLWNLSMPNKPTKRQNSTPPPHPKPSLGMSCVFTVILLSPLYLPLGLNQGARNARGRAPITVKGYNTMSSQQVAGQVEKIKEHSWEIFQCA